MPDGSSSDGSSRGSDPRGLDPRGSEAATWFARGVGALGLAVGEVVVRLVFHVPSSAADLLVFVGIGVAVWCFSQWWRTVRHPIVSPAAKRTFALWWTGGGVALFAIGAVLASGPDGGQSTVAAGFVLAGIAAVIGFWGAVFAVRFSQALGDEFTTATTPVPSPAEIAALLEAEWGRPASVVEVAAVHQMLSSARYEALLTTGLTLGALYLMDHNLHHDR